MSTSNKRLELHIDIFDEKKQLAMVLPTLKPMELIEAILQEFQDLEYLSDIPTNYTLLKATDKSPLDIESKLNQQLTVGEHLILTEKELPLPSQSTFLSKHGYLRDIISGKVYKLHWQPAIIGRPGKKLKHNDHLAVNLESFEGGLRVSRRQTQITEDDGQFYIESLSPTNPTLLKTKAGKTKTIGAKRQVLNPGETICLERSNISFKFIVRNSKLSPKKDLETKPSTQESDTN